MHIKYLQLQYRNREFKRNCFAVIIVYAFEPIYILFNVINRYVIYIYEETEPRVQKDVAHAPLPDIFESTLEILIRNNPNKMNFSLKESCRAAWGWAGVHPPQSKK